jgi:hypothetical protein
MARLVGCAQARRPTMGLDLMDVSFRIERRLGVRVTREDWQKLWETHEPPEVFVGELFDLVRGRGAAASVLDREVDGDFLWPMFQKALSDGLGVDLDEVTKDKGLFRDLGAD